MFIGTLLKNVIANAAVAGYNGVKTAKDAVGEQIDMAKMIELQKKENEFNKSIEHYSPEERKQIKDMKKRMSMVELAKESARDTNTLNRLKHEYNI